jgi:hypothetical protein
MVEKIVSRGRNVVDFMAYRQRTHSATPQPLVASPNYCSHCGAWLAEGESEDECSSLEAGGFRATGV